MCKNFVHLHAHSEYSLLDGYGSVKDMVARVSEIEQSSLAITDHGNMHGAIEFYRECNKHNIKPIVGAELYITQFGTPMEQKNTASRTNNHLLCLASTQDGYNNLLTLSSEAYIKGFYYKPRIDNILLETYKSGIIVTSGCMAAQVPSMILANISSVEYERAFAWYVDTFQENFFVELQHHRGIPELVGLNKILIQLAKKFNVKMVVTNDSHYPKPDNAHVHDRLLCIQMGTSIYNPNRMKFSDDEYYIKTREEMEREFAPYGLDNSIFDNTLLIAEMCNANPDLEKSNHHMPDIDIPSGYHDEDQYLRELVYMRLDDIYPNYGDEVIDRIEKELFFVQQAGFAKYYLIVRDICNFSREQKILFNTRGSAAGSILNYILGNTSIDPLANDLLFERYINISPNMEYSLKESVGL